MIESGADTGRRHGNAHRGDCTRPLVPPRGRLVTLETFIIDTFTRVGEDGIGRTCGAEQVSWVMCAGDAWMGSWSRDMQATH
jgi:hypothetical protein